MSALVLQVRFHDGRYHGEGDWPPSPARVFQALVAGVGISGPVREAEKKAFEWLEAQGAPLVAVPPAWQPRQRVRLYVPNNDGDTIDGDPRRMAKIRTATKEFRPYFFDAASAFVYAWPLPAGEPHGECARLICAIAERLYQLGRGIDMAWAWGEILADEEVEDLLAQHSGSVLRPSSGKGGRTLLCPCRGSFASLERRHATFAQRFRSERRGRQVEMTFSRPSRTHFRVVAYDSPPSQQVYELRKPGPEATFAPWPLARASVLVERLRDGAVQRLRDAMPSRKGDIDRALVGRKPDGTVDGSPEYRVRIVPLPSIGHVHADCDIRRVLVQVPPICPLRVDDVFWAFSGLGICDVDTGEVQALLTRGDDSGFTAHYGIGDGGYRVWRTVTAAALPEGAGRRRVDAPRARAEAVTASERVEKHVRAGAAVATALRHAGIRARLVRVIAQREPFDHNGVRAEAFAEGTRFPRARLWHVQIELDRPIEGPLVLGDGRFLGLGVCAPVSSEPGVVMFCIEGGNICEHDGMEICRALRRAVMARVRNAEGDAELESWLTGHEADGRPARVEQCGHVGFQFDPPDRLLVLAPHLVDRGSGGGAGRDQFHRVARALEGMSTLRAGRMGAFRVAHAHPDFDTDPLFACSQVWESRSPYLVNRHARRTSADDALVRDVREECARRGLPLATVEVRSCRGVRGRGLEGMLVLRFASAVRGPLVLGRSRYLGGGLFAARRETQAPR